MATTPFLIHRTTGGPTPERSSALVGRPRRGRIMDGPPSLVVASYVSLLQAETDPQERLQRGVDLLPVLVRGCHHASIATVVGGRVRVEVANDRAGRRAAELQDELDEGPALHAVRTGHSVVAPDLGVEGRWVAWCAAVRAELPVTSVLSVVLVTGAPQPSAVLDAGSDTVAGLGADDITLLHALAAPLADALRGARAGADLLGPAA